MNKSFTPPPSASQLAFNREMAFDYGVAHEIAPDVRRIVANNPTAFTFKGTNSYIVGRGDVAVIDPGPDDKAHIDALLDALQGERITQIIITHTHRDHCDGVDMLKSRTGATVMGYGPTERPRGVRTSSPSGKTFVDQNFSPDTALRDGDTVEGDGWKLDVIHTPGHAPDHLCFVLEEERSLFSGDNVLGVGTTVIPIGTGDLSEYMASLDRLLELEPTRIYPAHGPAIEEGSAKIREYIAHRNEREEQVLAALADERRTPMEVVREVYAAYPEKLFPAAAQSVTQHLLKLEREQRVSRVGDDPATATWSHC